MPTDAEGPVLTGVQIRGMGVLLRGVALPVWAGFLLMGVIFPVRVGCLLRGVILLVSLRVGSLLRGVALPAAKVGCLLRGVTHPPEADMVGVVNSVPLCCRTIVGVVTPLDLECLNRDLMGVVIPADLLQEDVGVANV